MTTVWLWYTDGPSSSAMGVTADDGTAKDAAKEGMITTGAVTAIVEQATHLAGGRARTSISSQMENFLSSAHISRIS